MSKEKILNELVRKLSESEKQTLIDHLKWQYAIEFKGEKMLRDDITQKVVELFHQRFILEPWDSKMSEAMSFETLDISRADIVIFTNTLLEEFDINFIELNKLGKWKTIGDIVDYIEDSLECALYDEENRDD